MPDIDGAVARRRRFAYVATFAALYVAYLCLRDSTWHGDIELHTLMETVATVLSLVVGSLALVRYYSKKDNKFLFIGTGFVATAFLDGYHAAISSSRFIESFSSFPPSHIAWSWFASRIFLALSLWMSWLFWRREDHLGAAGRISERLVYVTVTALALAFFAVVEFVPMPAVYYQQFFFPRPQELVPALFFLLALIGYLRKGKWKTNLFEHWLVLSLIVGFMAQVMFMSFSARLYDAMFDAAHLLKVGSYLCAMVGLLLSMRRLFSESLAQQALAATNTILATQQEVSPDAILVVDAQAKIISYNRRFVDLWGLTQEMVAAGVDEPVLRSVAAQVQDQETFLARIKYLYEHGIDESHEEIGLKDGRTIDRYSAPMVGTDGRYYGRIWFFRDITKRKQTDTDLRRRGAFIEALVETSADGIIVVDAKGKTILQNQRMIQLWKIPADVAADSDDSRRVQFVASRTVDAKQFVDKVVYLYTHPDETSQDEVALKDGTVLERYSAPVLDGNGHSYGRIWSFRDITERKRAEEMVQRSDAHLAEAQRISNVGSWELDNETNEVRWSVEAFHIFERDPASFVPSFEAFLATVHPDDRDALHEGLGRSIREHTPYEVEHRLLMKDGRIKHVHEQCHTSFDELGRPLRTVGTVQDITERIRSEQQIKLFRVLIDSAPDEIHVVDPATLRIIDANEGAWVKLGYTREELLALHVSDIDISDPEMKRAIGEKLLKDGAATFETYHKRKDGVTFPVEVMIQTVTLDRPYSMAIARDITERKLAQKDVQELQEQLRDQALRDPLTGLYNRRYLDETIKRELIRATRYDQPIGIVMCDIDHFKVVNDMYGHIAGDEVLRDFAEVLRTNVRSSDIVCRFGGEEFLLFFPDMPSDVAYRHAEQLRTALAARRITFGAAVIQVTASFGVAAFPENGITQDALIRAADVAMYEAKEAGRDRVVVSSMRGDNVPGGSAMRSVAGTK